MYRYVVYLIVFLMPTVVFARESDDGQKLMLKAKALAAEILELEDSKNKKSVKNAVQEIRSQLGFKLYDTAANVSQGVIVSEYEDEIIVHEFSKPIDFQDSKGKFTDYYDRTEQLTKTQNLLLWDMVLERVNVFQLTEEDPVDQTGDYVTFVFRRNQKDSELIVTKDRAVNNPDMEFLMNTLSRIPSVIRNINVQENPFISEDQMFKSELNKQ